MKKWFVLFLIFIQLALKSSGQVVTQTYLDPCSLKTYVVSIPICFCKSVDWKTESDQETGFCNAPAT